jgi:hypothetical protein
MSAQPERVVAAFLRGDSDEFVAECAPDVLLDANVPTWRYQLKGREGVRHVLAEEEFLAGRTVATWRSVPTADGLLLEHETHAPMHGERRMWRAVLLFRGAPGAWSEIVLYCTGIWDSETIARHAVEAPMVTS